MSAKDSQKHRDKQAALGRRGRLKFLTDKENKQVDQFIKTLRKTD